MFIKYDPENRVDSGFGTTKRRATYQDSENLSRIQVYSAGRLLYTISKNTQHKNLF